MNKIICNKNCHMMLQQMNACPLYDRFDFFNFIMILLSLTPYLSIIINLAVLLKYKTMRSLSLFGLFIFQVLIISNKNFFIKLLKDTLRDPRPNYECTRQFGNPSNHSTFFASIIMWYMLEYIYLDAKFTIKKKSFLVLVILTPLVCYARIYLLYQDFNQIINGLFLGGLVSIVWFFIFFNLILKGNNNFKRILKKYKFKNNLSKEKFDEIDIDSLPKNSSFRSLLEFQNKERELIKIKNDLIKFTSALKNMDIVKNARSQYEEKKESINHENKETLDEININKTNSEYRECLEDEEEDESKKDA